MLVDPTLGRIRLSLDELAAGQERARQRPEPDDPGFIELPANEWREPNAAVDRVLQVVAHAKFVLILEVAFYGPAIRHQFAGQESGLVQISPVEPDVIELMPIDVLTLPWAVAALARISPRPSAALTAQLTMPADALARADATMPRSQAAAATILTEAGLPAAEVEALVQTLARRQVTWRAVSTWTRAGDPVSTATASYLDAGRAGVVRLTPSEEGDVTIAPTTPAESWHDLLRLMPGVPG